jgi:hypothetical protein
VILRFDSGHPRRHVEPESPQMSEHATSNLLAAFFQSVIQTDALLNDSRQNAPEPKRSAGWHLVEPGEAQSQPVRKPIELESPVATGAEIAPESAATATLEPPPKPRHRQFWRLQAPHLSLHVISPERT